MKEKFFLRFSLSAASLGAAVLISAPAHAAERCKVMDPTGTPLNVRDENKNIIGKVENGRVVMAARFGKDDAGKPWAYVTAPGGEPIGWVYREFIVAFNEKTQSRGAALDCFVGFASSQ